MTTATHRAETIVLSRGFGVTCPSCVHRMPDCEARSDEVIVPACTGFDVEVEA